MLSKIRFMERREEHLSVRTRKDPAYRGHYLVELEAKLPGNLKSTQRILKSAGYTVIACDEEGATYASNNDPDLWVDADKADCCGKIQLVLHKDKLVKGNIDMSKEYLTRIYRQIADDIGTKI